MPGIKLSFSLLITTCVFTLLCGLSLSASAGETLRILAWPGYADADLVEKFEQRRNVDVEVSYVSTDDELWERINANKGADFDLFAVNTAELQRYIDQGLSIPLDVEKLPNLGNQLLTLLSNLFSDLNLTDMETCYKVFMVEVLERITLKSNRFGFEPEFTAKASRLGVRIYEVPISYHGRTYAEGKKIGWKDGVSAIWSILRFNLWDR